MIVVSSEYLEEGIVLLTTEVVTIEVSTAAVAVAVAVATALRCPGGACVAKKSDSVEQLDTPSYVAQAVLANVAVDSYRFMEIDAATQPQYSEADEAERMMLINWSRVQMASWSWRIAKA